MHARRRRATLGDRGTSVLNPVEPKPVTRDWPGRLAGVLTAAPAAGVAVVCCGLPLLWMAVVLGLNPTVWHEVHLTRWRAALMGRTLGYNAAAAVIATAMGLPAGLVLGRGRGAVAKAMWVVLPAALLMPSLSYAYGWAQFVRVVREGVGDVSGWVYVHGHGGRDPAPAMLPVVILVGLWAGVVVGCRGLLGQWLELRASRPSRRSPGCTAGAPPAGQGWGTMARAAAVVMPTVLLGLGLFTGPMRGAAVTVLGHAAYAVAGRWYDGDRIDLTIAPGGWVDTGRCIWSLAAWLWAVPAGLVGLALRRMDTDVAQAAVLDGALVRVTARQVLGTVVAAVAVVTVLATQEFAVYEPTGISVVATEMRMVFDTGSVSAVNNSITATGLTGAGAVSPDQAARAAAAVATALPLVLCTAVLAVVAVRGAGAAAATDAVSVGPWPRVLDAPAWAVAVTIGLVLLNVAVPVASLVGSLHVPFAPGRMLAEFGPQVRGTLLVAGIATAVAIVASASAAGRWTPGLMVAGGASFLIGGQLLAIALIRIYNRPVLGLDDWAYNAWPVPVAAYVGRFGWLAMAGARSTWGRPWRDLRAMASLDGAGTFATAWRVVWPLAWPTLAAGAVLVGALSLTEVPATVLLFPQNPQVLTPTLMTWVHMARFDPMIEASLLMMMAVLVPAAVAIALIAAGVRVTRLRTVAVLAMAAVLVGGCGRSATSEPDAVWLDTGTGPGQVVYPRGIAYSAADDTIFVVDRMARVQHLDHDGRFLNDWALPDRRSGKPVGLSVGPDGNVYVPDTHYYRVIVYSPLGKEVRRWGSFGRDPGQFIYPTDVEFDRRGRCFVSEYGDNDRIQVFDPAGRFLYQFGHFGQGDGEFIRPQDMVIDGDTLYVTDACNHRICVFTTAGQWVRNMGTCGSGPGQFRFPYGMDIDREGHLVVCEFGNNRVQRIDKATGRGLGTWGAAGRELGQLAYPWGVIVDKRDRVVTVDAGNNRLQVFSF